MNKGILKKLAELTVSEEEIGNKMQSFIFERLSKTDIKTYLSYLRNELNDKKVFVRSPEKMKEPFKKQIDNLYKDKKIDINYEQSKSLGAGLQIEHADNVWELNVEKIMTNTYKRIKENL